MNVSIRDPRFTAVVGEAVEFECLGDRFLFTEGPAWDARAQRLIFSDIPGDAMYQWSRSDGVQTFRRPSNKANGLTWDRDGRLLSCEHATSRVTRQEHDGALTVIASRYEGKELNSPNDIVVRRDGAIYFSDPTYGRLEYYGVPREPQLGFRGVYRIDAAPTRPARRRSCWPTTSRSPTGCASRPTSASSSSTTPSACTSGCSAYAATARSTAAACGPRSRATATAHPTA